MTGADLMTLAEEERADLAALLRTLTPTQWNTRSLCPDWTVRDVALHIVSYEELTTPGLLATFLRGGLRVRTINDVAMTRYRDITTDDIINLVERHQRPRGLTSGFKGGIALTDGTIHQQDIRRPLGLTREIPEHRLVQVLDFSLGAPTLPSKRNSKGLHLSATDVSWSHGDGPEVSGPGEALLMAVAGRPDALNQLTGEGASVLADRITAPSAK
jgi:uncharacterized protein (TIGR03083 family)